MVWRIYERFNVFPPPDIDISDNWSLALLLAYEQVRQLEEIPPEIKIPKIK